VLSHDTLYNAGFASPDRAGTDCTDQLLPSHDATDALVNEPTAKQLVALGHDTSVRPVELALSASEFATMLQLVPFQCSISATADDKKSALLEPTAKQSVGLAHDTPLSCAIEVASGFGLVTADQALPSQCSTHVTEPVSVLV
jgi:hypothetical protein